jgi:hypothetical protein
MKIRVATIRSDCANHSEQDLMRGLRRSTQRARHKGKIAQGAAIQMNHFLLNVEMSEWRSGTEQGIRTMQRRFAARSPPRPTLLPRRSMPICWASARTNS